MASNKKVNYVSSKKVMQISKGAQYIIVYGAYSNGKSYAVKSGVVEECYKHDKMLAYIRRYQKEDTDANAENYFLDCPVEQITGGEYSAIICYQHWLYFANYDAEKAKYIKGQKLGRRFNLWEAFQTKSGVYPEMDFAIFEEFISLDQIPQEPYRLQRLISTISRNDNLRCFMVGNTISPMNSFFREFQLTGIPKQKVGTVDTYRLKTKLPDGSDTETVIKVYLTVPTNKRSNMLIGNVAREGHGGSFHVEEHNHLDCKYTECKVLYRMVVCFEGQKMLMEFIRDKKNAHMWYVTPKTSNIQDKTRTIGQLRTMSKYHTNQFTPLSDREKKMFDYIKIGKVAYMDNLTGTLFLQMYRGIEGSGFEME